VRRLIARAEERTLQVLRDHRKSLDQQVDALLTQET